MCPCGDRRSWVASEIDPHLLRITGKNNMTEHLLPPPHIFLLLLPLIAHCDGMGPKSFQLLLTLRSVINQHCYSANIKRNLTRLDTVERIMEMNSNEKCFSLENCVGIVKSLICH